MPDMPDDMDLQDLLSEDRFLRSLAGSLVGAADAEDAAQHVWLRTLEDPVRKPGSLRGFLTRILTRTARNVRRETSRRRQRERSTARSEALPSAADMAAREELRRHVGAAVLSLEEPYRTTVWLRFRDELPPREVARAMRVPVETVRTRTRRALEQLRQRLDRTYGDREGWGAAFVPLISRTRNSLSLNGPAVLVAGVMMKKTLAAVLFVFLLSLTALGTWSLFSAERTPSRVAESSPAATFQGQVGIEDVKVDADGRLPLAAGMSPHESPVSLAGTLLQADGSTAAEVPYWSWGERRPQWAHPPSVEEFYGEPATLPDPEGHTGRDGSWRLRPGSTAVTFAPLEDSLVTYELDSSSSQALSLPDLGRVQLRLEGARPDQAWEATLLPTLEGPEYGMHLHRSLETAGHQVTLSLRGRKVELAGAETAALEGIAGLEYTWEIRGLGIRLDRESIQVTAPAKDKVKVLAEEPVVQVTVLDPGGTRVMVDGEVVFWVPEEIDRDPSLLPSSARIEDGLAFLGGEHLPRDTELAARIRLSDGEQFSTGFRIGDEEMHRELRVTRGQGRKASLVVILPEDARLLSPRSRYTRGWTVMFEGPDGVVSWTTGDPLNRTTTLWGLSYPNAIEGGPRALILRELPEGWRQLWVFMASGRVARLDNPGPVEQVSLDWLPDTELEEVSMAEVLAEVPVEGPGVRIGLRLEMLVQGYSGRTYWHPVDALTIEPERLLLQAGDPALDLRFHGSLQTELERPIEGTRVDDRSGAPDSWETWNR